MSESTELERAIFNEALDLPSAESRAVFLADACGGDPALREKMEALLKAHFSAEGFLPTKKAEPGDFTKGPLCEGPGTVIGRYKLLQRLGEGGFGIVYMAEQKEPVKRRVALKIIKLGMDTKQVVARFEAERQALALMDHPNVAKVFDGGSTDGGRPYFVMELVRGIPITKYCDENCLITDKRLELFMTVCLAVQHAHQKGIIHRDIKPSNILVTLHDGVPVPKVIDFGIAKATQQELTEKTLFTQFQQMIGTPTYMSPEQAEMSGLDIDTRTDVYSLGVLLYELLIGKTPLDEQELLSGGYDEIRRRIREEEPLKPSTRARTLQDQERTAVSRRRKVEPRRLEIELKGDLDWIVMKALEKDRTRRYDTAKDFANDVLRHLNHEPVEAAAPSVGYRCRKFLVRHRTAMAVTVTIAGLLVSGTVVSTMMAIRATVAQERERNAKEQTQLALERATAAERNAKSQTALAQAGQRAARRSLYAAELSLARQSVKEGNIDRGISLLKRQIPQDGESDLRGFEWAYLWDQIHRHRSEMVGHTGDIDDIAISPNGRLLASASVDGTTRLWDLYRGDEVGRIDNAATRWATVHFSPDGKLLATTTAETNGGQEILLWDVSARREVGRLGGHPGSIACVRFAPDGKTLYAGCPNGNLQVWNLSDQSATIFKAHRGYVNAIAFSQDNSKFVTCGGDGTVRIWDRKTHEPTATLSEHQAPVYDVACAPDRDVAVSAGRYGKVMVWDLREGKVLETRAFDADRYGPAKSVEFSTDGSILAIGFMSGQVCLLHTEDWQEFASYNASPLLSLALSPVDDRFVSGGTEGQLAAKDFASEENKSLLSDPGDRPRSVRVSPDGATLAVGMATGSIRVWDLGLDRERFLISGRRINAGALSSPFDYHFFDYSPDGRTLATVTHRNQVDLWDLDTGTLKHSLHHSTRTYAVDWSPDGRRIAGGGPKGGITIWSVDTRERVREFQGHGGRVNALTYSPDGRHLVTTTWERIRAGKIKVWEVATGALVAQLEGHRMDVGVGDVLDMVFSPDGSLLATAAADRRVILWDVASWKQKAVLFGHAGPIADLSFSPDGSRLASAGFDDVVRLWDLATSQEVFSLDGTLAEFAPGDFLLVTAETTWLPIVQRTEPMKLLLHRPPSVADIDRRIRDRGGGAFK